MSINAEQYIGIIQEWWDSFPLRSQTRGNIAGGLVILENLRSEFTLYLERHKAAGSDQLRNATGPNVRNILARFGENRILLREGGRTNRGLMRNLAPLLISLASSDIEQLDGAELTIAIDAMQAFLVERARDIFNDDWISFDYSSGVSSMEVVERILTAARARHKAGEVAEYLVGAKLALRFPAYEVRNSAASSADAQREEHGDFQINDSVFHVTVAPNRGHYDKCKNNLANGLRVFLLVPEERLIGARQSVETEIGNGVSVLSIESFVSQNIEELSEFAGDRVAQSLKDLLEKYNERVAAVETDLSLRITAPASMGA